MGRIIAVLVFIFIIVCMLALAFIMLRIIMQVLRRILL